MVLHDDQTLLGEFSWGLVPSWADDQPSKRLINARMETIADKPSFRDLFLRRRCLVLADGFYEWKREGRRKQPYYFYLPDREPFAMAGLYDVRNTPGEGKISTCTIITTAADDVMKPVHHRMPVMLDESAWKEWMTPGSRPAAELHQLLQDSQLHSLLRHPVSALVNSPTNDIEDCIREIAEPAAEPDLFD
jgi:putative SOS response-associated peptidase YedK